MPIKGRLADIKLRRMMLLSVRRRFCRRVWRNLAGTLGNNNAELEDRPERYSDVLFTPDLAGFLEFGPSY